MITVKAGLFDVSWISPQSLWRVEKLGCPSDFILAPQVKVVSGDHILFYNPDGSKKTKTIHS